MVPQPFIIVMVSTRVSLETGNVNDSDMTCVRFIIQVYHKKQMSVASSITTGTEFKIMLNVLVLVYLLKYVILNQ